MSLAVCFSFGVSLFIVSRDYSLSLPRIFCVCSCSVCLPACLMLLLSCCIYTYIHIHLFNTLRGTRMSVTLEVIAQSLTLLRQARVLDLAGDTGDAAEMYGAAKTALECVTPYLPRDYANVVHHNIERIDRRLSLITCKERLNEQKAELPLFPIEYVPRQVPGEKISVPIEPMLRVFWLMRRLQVSMRQGAFVSPHLYVAKEVWYQNGGGSVVSHIGIKIRYLTSLCNAMEQLRTVGHLSDIDGVLRVLRNYFKLVEELTGKLAMEIGLYDGAGLQKSKGGRSVRSLFQRGRRAFRSWREKKPSMELYIIWAINALEQTHIFERWFSHFSQMSKSSVVADILQLLRKVVVYLYNAPCTFLLRDMSALVERYHTNCWRGATGVLPVEIKFGCDSRGKLK
uniref:Uncharacterized protein TCIL3000_7_40 n=1 Tax=Trypanosoma congolense (strain IL3000) TaxID=1068625 RepID=G0UP94_TRYCI|nr:unnamed protein product [Trypanosoma congolense IL3000]